MKYARSRTGPPRSTTQSRSCATSPGAVRQRYSGGWPNGNGQARPRHRHGIARDEPIRTTLGVRRPTSSGLFVPVRPL